MFSTKISIADAYAKRIDKNVWLTKERYNNNLQKLREIAVRKFIALFCTRKCGSKKNKICKHMNNRAVAFLNLRYSSNKNL